MIGIIGAMAIEVEGLKNRMEDVVVETISGIAFYQGTLSGVECVVAQSGVGKVNAAMCAESMILKYQPAVVVNSGVAGGIGKGVCVGDVVISSGLVQHDFDTSDLGDPKGMLPGVEKVVVPAAARLTAMAAEKAREVYDGTVHVGIIATGDQFIGTSDVLKAIHNQFDAIACEMEGGAIAQVCYLNGVDFIVIRAISDNADEKANISFAQFAPVAAEKSTSLMEHLLPVLVSCRGGNTEQV